MKYFGINPNKEKQVKNRTAVWAGFPAGNLSIPIPLRSVLSI